MKELLNQALFVPEDSQLFSSFMNSDKYMINTY